MREREAWQQLNSEIRGGENRSISPESVLGLIGTDVVLSGSRILVRRHVVAVEAVRVLSDFDEKRDTPAATSPRPEAFRHLTGTFRPHSSGVIDQLPQGDVVAVADMIVG